jgi:hypothetical protein
MPVPARLLVLLALLLAPRAEADPIGLYDDTIHDRVEIVFQFAPTGGTAVQLSLGLASGILSGGYQGCSFQLFDGGGLVSSSTIANIFGCQGVWRADATVVDPLIDTNVDLSGLAAGEVGRIVMSPIFNPGPSGLVSLAMPSLGLVGGGAVTILSQSIVPEPSTAVLALTGLATLAGLAAPAGRRPRAG